VISLQGAAPVAAPRDMYGWGPMLPIGQKMMPEASPVGSMTPAMKSVAASDRNAMGGRTAGPTPMASHMSTGTPQMSAQGFGMNSAPSPQRAAVVDNNPELVSRLHSSVKMGDAEGVKRLLMASVDPDAVDQSGSTPLLVAAGRGHLGVIEQLIAFGADANISKDGNTPMTMAFQRGHKDVLKLLFAAAYQSLESVCGPSGMMVPTSTNLHAYDGGDEVPLTAISELREVTKRLADLGNASNAERLSPRSPQSEPMSVKGDSEAMRESAVRDAMRTLVRA